MPTDWNSAKASQRLLAAIVAAQDIKPNYNKIARMFGEGATYHSIEGRFRTIKREAAALLLAANNESPTPSSSLNTTPKKPPAARKEAGKSTPVKTGRVAKKGTPAAKKAGRKQAVGIVTEGKGGIKEEEEENVLDGGREGGAMDFGDVNGGVDGVDGLGGMYGELLEEGMEA